MYSTTHHVWSQIYIFITTHRAERDTTSSQRYKLWYPNNWKYDTYSLSYHALYFNCMRKNMWNLPYPIHLSHIWASHSVIHSPSLTKSFQSSKCGSTFTNIRIKYMQNIRGEGHIGLIHKKKWHKTFLPCDLWQLKYWLTQLKYSLLICDILFYNTVFAYSQYSLFCKASNYTLTALSF